MKDNRIQFFTEGLTKLIDYHRKENRLSYAEVIGLLEIAQQDIYAEMMAGPSGQSQPPRVIEGDRKDEIDALLDETNVTCTSCFSGSSQFFSGWMDENDTIVIGKDELLCPECAKLRGVRLEEE